MDAAHRSRHSCNTPTCGFRGKRLQHMRYIPNSRGFMLGKMGSKAHVNQNYLFKLQFPICAHALGPRFVLVLGFGGQVRIMWIAFITDEPKPNLTLVCPSSLSPNFFTCPLHHCFNFGNATLIECSHLNLSLYVAVNVRM